jgi:hypothetical protein
MPGAGFVPAPALLFFITGMAFNHSKAASVFLPVLSTQFVPATGNGICTFSTLHSNYSLLDEKPSAFFQPLLLL